MPCIKVGLDEWVIVDSSDLQESLSLWTDGLSGCVGIAIQVPPKALVAHVYSGLNASNWETEYKPKLVLALDALGSLKTAKDIQLTLGDDDRTERSRLIAKFLDDLLWEQGNQNIETGYMFPKTGVRLHYTDQTWQFQSLTNLGHKAEWGKNENSDTGHIPATDKGFLSTNGKVAEV